jgi:hypothetical protein
MLKGTNNTNSQDFIYVPWLSIDTNTGSSWEEDLYLNWDNGDGGAPNTSFKGFADFIRQSRTKRDYTASGTFSRSNIDDNVYVATGNFSCDFYENEEECGKAAWDNRFRLCPLSRNVSSGGFISIKDGNHSHVIDQSVTTLGSAYSSSLGTLDSVANIVCFFTCNGKRVTQLPIKMK